MTGAYAAPVDDRVVPDPKRRSDSPRTAWVSGVFAFAVLGGAIPMYLLAAVENVGRSDAWPLTWLVLMWAGARLSLLVGRGQPRLFELFFWLYVYIFLGLAPTVQMRSDQLSGTTPGMDPAVDLPTAAIVVVGLVAYELGRAVGVFGSSWSRRTARTEDPAGVRTARISPVRTAILFFAASAAASYYLSRIGLGEFFSSREEALAARVAAFPDRTTRATVAGLGLYPLLIAVGALVQLRRTTLTGGQRRLVTLALGAGILLVLLQVSPVSNARYTVGTAFFALAVYLGATRTTLRARTTMIATIGAFLFVFPLADAFRRQGGASFDRGGFFGEYRGNGDYDSFWQIANAYSYWGDGLVDPFRQLTGSLLFWLPRSVWSGKPSDTGVVLANYRHYSFDNLSAPLWAEALVNGGLGLLIVVFFVLGWLLHRLDAKVVSTTPTGGPWVIAGAVLAVYLTILLRGSLLQATGGFALALAALLFVSVHSRPQGHTAAGGPP
jgi:hypothetical protein